MPIRFRCRHCKQNLGISRTKAGEVVDCPTCGRSIRVPPRDGPAESAGRPQMDFQDPAVAKAMAEIQSLGNVKVEGNHDSSDENVSVGDPHEQMPIMLSEPEIEPPPVLEIEPISSRKKSPEPPGGQSRPSEDDNAEQNRKELERLVAQAEEQKARTQPVQQSFGLSIPMIGGLVLVFGLVIGLGIGYLVYDPVPTQAEPNGEPSGDEKPSSTEPSAVGSNELTVRGVITYDPENAATRPDTQSLVVLLAESPLGQVKIPGESLWEPDDSTDFQVAAAALELIGGRAALTDAEGRFSFAAPQPGSFHLIVVSRHALREGSAVDSSLEDVLKKYFEQPRQLLGRRAYHVKMLNVDGERLSPIRHRFKR